MRTLVIIVCAALSACAPSCPDLPIGRPDCAPNLSDLPIGRPDCAESIVCNRDVTLH